MALHTVDDRKRVVPDPSKSVGPVGSYRQPAAGQRSSQQLVHELANLLDGSLRNITLALSELQRSEPGQSASGASGASGLDDDKLVARLQTVNQAMGQMATLIRRWQSSADLSVQELHEGELTVGQAVDQAMELAGPVVWGEGIKIRVVLSDEVSRLPVGPIYPVIANALRNSIDALQGQTRGARAGVGEIEVVGRVVGGTVELSVLDTGPGFAPELLDESGEFRYGQSRKRGGKGLGLALCRDIAASLAGTLELSNRSPRGAMVTLRYPLR